MDTLVSVLVRILEAIFIVGILGSAVVLSLTLIEDAKSLLPGGDKKEKESGERGPSRARSAHPELHTSDPIA
jgi:hypothetical protein